MLLCPSLFRSPRPPPRPQSHLCPWAALEASRQKSRKPQQAPLHLQRCAPQWPGDTGAALSLAAAERGEPWPESEALMLTQRRGHTHGRQRQRGRGRRKGRSTSLADFLTFFSSFVLFVLCAATVTAARSSARLISTPAHTHTLFAPYCVSPRAKKDREGERKKKKKTLQSLSPFLSAPLSPSSPLFPLRPARNPCSRTRLPPAPQQAAMGKLGLDAVELSGKRVLMRYVPFNIALSPRPSPRTPAPASAAATGTAPCPPCLLPSPPAGKPRRSAGKGRTFAQSCQQPAESARLS